MAFTAVCCLPATGLTSSPVAQGVGRSSSLPFLPATGRAFPFAARSASSARRFRAKSVRLLHRAPKGLAGNGVAAAAAAPAQEKPATLDKTGYHVHFGAGKLGMGLVFPALVASNVPFAIMQPPFPGECDAILDDERVSVLGNGEEVLPGGLLVVKSDTFEDLKTDMMGDRSLVLIHEGPEWDEIIKNATSFSCSIGPKVNDIVGPVLERNKEKVPYEMRPQLFACENDHNAVEALDARLKGRVEVVPCMVDRICSDREIVKGQIKVTTEPWKGTLVPLTPQPEEQDRPVPLPFGGQTVFIPTTERESDYMYERKIMTVNHMHTTLAFTSLVEYMTENDLEPADIVSGESACISIPLVKWDASLTNPKTNTIWCWAVAQCLLLMSEHDRKTMMKSHKCTTDDEFVQDLLNRAKEKLNRFAAVEDSTARVLNAGVDLRYQGRLLPAYEAVQNLAGMLDQWPEDNRYTKLMEAAGVDINDILSACEYLVRAAEPIAAADAAKYNLAKAEPDKMYSKLLRTLKKAADDFIDWEKSNEYMVDSTAEEARDALSSELEQLAEQGVKDLSLDWVVCKLESLGFENVRQWEESVKPTYGAKKAEDKASQTPKNMEDVADEQGVLLPGWMLSWEESKRKEGSNTPAKK